MVSEMMDLCIRRILLHCLSRVSNGQRSLFSIPLSLLDGISSSHFLGEKQYVQWHNRQTADDGSVMLDCWSLWR
ncbi:hypothetical protein AKJ16_DCAP13041 [Drosera capensis]